jgi:serine/threonine protein kinase
VSFEKRQEIGQAGKNSRVHVIYDVNLDAELVMKTVPKAKLDVPTYFAEAQLLYKSVHPNVVPILYACEDADSIYLAMPHFKHGSLAGVVKRRFLTVREVIRYAAHFLAGLHNVHSKGLVHFDVKLDNILIGDRNEALLSDFGLAKQMNHAGVAEQDAIYLKTLPPEYFLKTAFGVPFDIYQVGLTLHRLINGNDIFYQQFERYGVGAAFDRERFKFDVINERFPKRDMHYEHVPNKLRSVIAKCLKREPAARYRTATAIVSDLAGIDGAQLDWQYQVDGDGSRIWSKVDGGRELRLRINDAGRAVAEKGPEGGPLRRITAYCKDDVRVSDIRRFIRTDGA